jgi:hypothetical protein
MTRKAISTTYSIFHRHGHRAASDNLFSNDKTDWSHKVCHPQDTEHLNSQFPVVNFNLATEDNATFPFGAITKFGAAYMKDIGRNLALKFPLLKSLSGSKVNVYSTNYRRTQVRKIVHLKWLCLFTYLLERSVLNVYWMVWVLKTLISRH